LHLIKIVKILRALTNELLKSSTIIAKMHLTIRNLSLFNGVLTSCQIITADSIH